MNFANALQRGLKAPNHYSVIENEELKIIGSRHEVVVHNASLLYLAPQTAKYVGSDSIQSIKCNKNINSNQPNPVHGKTISAGFGRGNPIGNFGGGSSSCRRFQSFVIQTPPIAENGIAHIDETKIQIHIFDVTANHFNTEKAIPKESR